MAHIVGGQLEDASWRFRLLDENKDAAMSKSEAAGTRVADRMIVDLDDNANNELSWSEFQDISVCTSGDPFNKQ